MHEEDSQSHTDEDHSDSTGSFSDCDASTYSTTSSDTSSSDDSEEPTTAADRHAGLYMSLEMVRQLRLSTSEGNLMGDHSGGETSMLATSRRRHSGGTFGLSMVHSMQTKSSMESHAQHSAYEANIAPPRETYLRLLKENGILHRLRAYSDIPQVFTKGCVSSHSLELMTAVRKGDLETIRKHNNRELQCCNKFGESIVHAAARRGKSDILRYLQEQNISLRVCCDGGRTPLHDAAWTADPVFDAIRILLDDCPDFLLVRDKRGCTPLEFVPKDAHEMWNAFLQENIRLVLPKGLLD